MPSKIDTDTCNEVLAKQFLTAFSALRSHIATQAVIDDTCGLNMSQVKMLHLIFHKPGISQTLVAEHLGVTTAAIRRPPAY